MKLSNQRSFNAGLFVGSVISATTAVITMTLVLI
jgi:hypothetical protein